MLFFQRQYLKLSIIFFSVTETVTPPKKDEAGFQPATLSKGQKKKARQRRQKEEKEKHKLELKKLKFGDDFMSDYDPDDDEIYGPPKPSTQ